MEDPEPPPDSYYCVLGVAFRATQEEIRKQYHSVVRTLHPDHRRPGGSSAEVLDQFHKVQAAWRCLSDPTRRLLYDLRNFGKSSVSPGKVGKIGLDAAGELDAEGAANLLSIQKEQANIDVRNMEYALGRILRREQAVGGVIIRKALYGDLRLREESFEEGMLGRRTIREEDLIGPFIDVTLPLQALVEKHSIVLPGGAYTSKADIPGFYNPVPLDLHAELNLYVLYDFRGNQHENIVGDRECLSLPYRKHLVPANQEPRGPFSPANVALCKGGSANISAASASVARIRNAAAGKKVSKEEALHKAVLAYRLQSLVNPVPGEATPKEFLVVSLAAGLALTLAYCWAAKTPPRALVR
eukprot:TRINITY_DN26462_c0_g1_i1.p1 TRINITY_DN26462_c0_g1~~TRINITY_DN26462_c0_g1_i1.p1  ORF type:complete len:356 (+),score=85.54 TRINITY_DN26462_c0_g1_i1:76-1143(+)